FLNVKINLFNRYVSGNSFTDYSFSVCNHASYVSSRFSTSSETSRSRSHCSGRYQAMPVTIRDSLSVPFINKLIDLPIDRDLKAVLRENKLPQPHLRVFNDTSSRLKNSKSKFRPLASHGTLWRHSKILHRCDM